MLVCFEASPNMMFDSRICMSILGMVANVDLGHGSNCGGSRGQICFAMGD
jgi:hypothetical protein